MLTRRKMLAGCAGSLTFAATSLGFAGIALARKSKTNNKKRINLYTGLSQDKFRALLGEWFYAYDNSGLAVDLRLVDVIDYPADENLDQFILQFSGTTPPALADGLVELEHLSAGKTYMYLEVRQSGAFESSYHATCNLMK